MNGKNKTDRELIEEIFSLLFGNPTHQTGLCAKVEMLEKAVKNNTRLSWAIFITILGSVITILIK